MDLVELAMEIEDAFGIRIPDDDYVQMETVGDVYEYLRRRRSAGPMVQCTTQSHFYRLRAAMVKCMQLEREAIRPDVQLDSLLPARQWRRQWSKLADASGLQLPGLRVRRSGTSWAGLLVVATVAVAPLGLLHSPGRAIALAGILLATAAWIAVKQIELEQSTSPQSTIRAVLEKIVGNELTPVSSDWTDERIWLKLKELVVKVLGVQPHEVTRQAHFIRDLGAG